MDFRAKDKFYSMKRSYERFMKICTDNGTHINDTEAKDAAEDFFNQCYHLKDWLKKDTEIKLIEDVEAFVHKGSQSLVLAGVYCNSLKHGGLRICAPGPKLDQVLTHVYLLQPSPKGYINYSRVEIRFGGKKYDALTLATQCMKEWEAFLGRNGIEFPPP